MPDTPPPKTTPPKTTKFRPRIATVDDPMIGAVADAFFRFESQKQAAEKLAHISKHYIRAKEQEPDSLRLWIRGFAVTPEEKSDGYRGHFARITIAAIDSGRFTLKALSCQVLGSWNSTATRRRSARKNAIPTGDTRSCGRCRPENTFRAFRWHAAS